ncbi:hypothetical protein ACKI10_33890 [Streptomyces galilaeus]|uniref:Uncharacterized protein n=1 Tax=Streptomyces galilaeus TaxID=33899 RepID=A0ABW9ILR4_STRGJ
MHGTPHIVSDVMTHTVAAIGRGAAFKEIVRMKERQPGPGHQRCGLVAIAGHAGVQGSVVRP